MVIFIGAWAMMFACLFFAYGALRLGASEWPPLGQSRLSIALPGLNTAFIALSSGALELGLWETRRARVRRLAPMLLLTAMLGAVFVIVQCLIGSAMYDSGLTPQVGPYASVLYGLAGIHGVHAAVGVIALSWLAVRAFQGTYNTPLHLPVRLWSMYWHFVGIVWVLMFVFVFAI